MAPAINSKRLVCLSVANARPGSGSREPITGCMTPVVAL